MPLESVEEGFNRWRDRAQAAELEVQRLQAEIEQLTEASRRFLNQRQEMAEERYAWQERGDLAEERLTRVRQWVTSDVVTARSEFGNGYREAQRDIRDLLAAQPTPLTPCTCRQAVHGREHTNQPIPGCPWCTPAEQTTPGGAS